MSKFFILILFAINLVCFNQVMASPNLDQNVIFNEDTKTGEGKDGTKGGTKGDEKNPEDDCE